MKLTLPMTLSQVRDRLKQADQFEAENAALTKALEVSHAYGPVVHELQAENAALTKRVAELEAQLNNECSLRVQATDAAYDLQSQLAWTPVRDGLPTEPGWYEVASERKQAVDVFQLTRHSDGLWWWLRDTRHESPLERYPSANIFRRIELPKEGET